MSTYHVVAFDDSKASDSLTRDLATLGVPDWDHTEENGEFKVWIRVPDGTPVYVHRKAVAAISLGRGSHTITLRRREDVLDRILAEIAQDTRGDK